MSATATHPELVYKVAEVRASDPGLTPEEVARELGTSVFAVIVATDMLVREYEETIGDPDRR